ncbi:riboflavin biosynthesis protein RibF [Hahella sp. CCB-MM4]|uniref:bifunctional riboflavin kinase/FAD synthetase n=1 Tax=Hahella sp. (strain CCB-MM4) TaxID=1926491 RepID=UPI000B9C0C70|nr:bifunctional riboflavin kinase/FAD synthetase [Hahella sp. CCB-MM4]OZG71468.1 riboflavin biosynthesis protein RibF [Hahella sp. CCB-MM4]
MRLIRGLHNLHSFSGGCVATIGNFDGVHYGHQVIIRQLQAKAKAMQLPAVVMVFEPQPREFFDEINAPARLMRFREKLEAIAALEVDVVLCLQFNRRLRHLEAQQFIDQVLVEGLHVKHLVVGDDFRFGCDRAGDFALLQKAGELNSFSVDHTATVEVGGARVSSTRLRRLLGDGRFEKAEELLGHPYSISGRVLHGRKLGRQLNVPTANVNLGRRRPALKGVYVVDVLTESGEMKPGVANVGFRPTIEGGDPQPTLEVHLLDFDRNLYGQRLQVIFLEKLRDEQRFADLTELKTRIHQDIEQARQFFIGRPKKIAEQ